MALAWSRFFPDLWSWLSPGTFTASGAGLSERCCGWNRSVCVHVCVEACVLITEKVRRELKREKRGLFNNWDRVFGIEKQMCVCARVCPGMHMFVCSSYKSVAPRCILQRRSVFSQQISWTISDNHYCPKAHCIEHIGHGIKQIELASEEGELRLFYRSADRVLLHWTELKYCPIFPSDVLSVPLVSPVPLSSVLFSCSSFCSLLSRACLRIDSSSCSRPLRSIIAARYLFVMSGL